MFEMTIRMCINIILLSIIMHLLYEYLYEYCMNACWKCITVDEKKIMNHKSTVVLALNTAPWSIS